MTQRLAELLEAQYGARTEDILRGYRAKRAVTFRLNRLRGDLDIPSELAAYGIAVRRVGWYRDAFIADGVEEDELRKTPFYEGGNIYLQSLSSMLPPLYLDPKAGESILDMTAAPGGKTTEICALSEGGALVTACERDKIRFERMRFNFARLGANRIFAIRGDALALDDAFSFDKILLDAPCTGSGTVSCEKPYRFTDDYLRQCAALQEKLLKKALRLLKKGGTLVYSTCSVLRQENEEVLKRCLGGTTCVLQPVSALEGLPLLPAEPGTICICPTEEYEGFFLAKIIKN